MSDRQPSSQISLFDVQAEYMRHGDRAMDNETLYERLGNSLGLSNAEMKRREPIGEKGESANLFTRRIRWHQQTLKSAGILERIETTRGMWRLAGNANTELKENLGKVSVVAFSTQLGAAIWGLCQPTFENLDVPITLCLTSPPYLLRKARAYGNIRNEDAYIDFICNSLEPVVRALRPGGSICLNVSNDCFLQGSPARSMYRERLMLALHDRLGLYKADELIWVNPNKPPGPMQWSSKTRQQLNTGYEPIYWLTNDPSALLSDNRRVLQPHTEAHMAYLQSGRRPDRVGSDGAYRHTANSYKNITPGRIPRNVLNFSSNCGSQRQYKRLARDHGLPAHGAPMPLELAKFLIELMTRPGELVVDVFAGSNTTGLAAEILGRPWLSTESMYEYALGSGFRFSDCNGFLLNQHLYQAMAA